MESMIITETCQNVAVIRFNRPHALNALNIYMLCELMDALGIYDHDENIKAIVITGDERAFAAGADIKEMANQSAIELFNKDFIGLFHRMRTIQKPIVAAVSGFCLGGGHEIALACDLIVASETARFGQPEITLGIIPGAGGIQHLTRTLGKNLAMEMVINNRLLTAGEALDFGLINHVFTIQEYFNEALKLATEIASKPPLAVRLAKEAVNNAFELSLSQGLQNEERSFYLLFSSLDQKEGMNAFLEKRPPIWHGK